MNTNGRFPYDPEEYEALPLGAVGLRPFPPGSPGNMGYALPRNGLPSAPRVATKPFGLGQTIEELLHGREEGPPLDEIDLQRMWAEGQLPPDFHNGAGIDEFGRGPLGPNGGVQGNYALDQARRVLEQEESMRARLPETAEEIVRLRGILGYSYSELQPLNLGRGALLSAGQTNVVILESRGLDKLTPIAVALGYNVRGELLDTDDCFVQARVRWGIGGAQHEAWVDVGRGTQIRLNSASYLQVAMSYLPDPSTTPPRTGPDLEGIALAGYGLPSFRPSPGRYTQRIGSLSQVESADISAIVPIPKFASSFGVIGEGGTIVGATAIMYPALVNDGNGHQAVAILSDGQDESQYPIGNGYRGLQINNSAGTLTQAFNIIYTIMV